MPAPTKKWISILIPAAGASSRMRGHDKLLESVRGKSLLRHCAVTALESVASEVIVTLREGQYQRYAVISTLPIKVLVSEHPREGMAGSIRSGLQAVSRDSTGAVILLPDMPEIRPSDIDALIGASRNGSIVRATCEDGSEGHPVLLPRELFKEAMSTSGDAGPRRVIECNRQRLRLIRLQGNRARLDLDAPDDWKRWRNPSVPRRDDGAGGGT